MKFLNDCTPNFKKFFAWSAKYLEKHDKKVIIVNSRGITQDGVKCSGWCDGDEIVAARKNPLFEEVYVHEFSHMQQAVEESPYWKDTSLFWRHLEKGKVAINSWDSVLDIIALERDCEKRAVAHSKKWQLFDNEQYSKSANLYLHYYQYVFLKRKWLNSTRIYNPLLLRAMPDKIRPLADFKHIDMNLMSLFDDCLDRKGKFHKLGGALVST